MARVPELPVRPSWDELFLTICREVSKRSTCSRVHAGAVLVKDNRIISMGYNGSPPGSVHCRDYWVGYWNDHPEVQKKFWVDYNEFIKSGLFYKLHHEWSVLNEIHAEQNAILFAAKNGIKTEGSVIYVTYSPCIDCAKAISQAGIKKVVFDKVYDRSADGLDFLTRASVEWQEGP